MPDTKTPEQFWYPMTILKWKCLQLTDGIPIAPPRNSQSIGFIPVFTSREDAEREYPDAVINLVERKE